MIVEQIKTCPSCGKEILASDRKCKYCGYTSGFYFTPLKEKKRASRDPFYERKEKRHAGIDTFLDMKCPRCKADLGPFDLECSRCGFPGKSRRYYIAKAGVYVAGFAGDALIVIILLMNGTLGKVGNILLPVLGGLAIVLLIWICIHLSKKYNITIP